MPESITDAPARQSRTLSLIGILALIALTAVILLTVRSLGAGQTSAAPANAGLTPLHEAAAAGDAAAVRQLAARNANLEAPVEDGPIAIKGMTPLILAAYKGNAEAVRALLDAGARIEARSADGRTALIYAAGWADVATVNLLLEAGARADARADAGMTALMFAAAARPEPAVLNALIDAGADVNARNKWRQDPLMIAARAGSLEKVERLLAAGADATATDLNGDTALTIAAETDGVEGLILETLIRAGADVNAATVEGITPLMKAARSGRLDLVELLLEAGAAPDATDENNWTAADWARNRQDEAGAAIADILK